MKNQVLNIEEMQELKKLGIDTSKASMCWIKIFEIPKPLLVDVSEKDFYEHCFRLEYFIPAFTVDDILNIIPDIIVDNTTYIPLLYKSGDLWVIDYHRAADFNKTFLPNGIDIMCCCETMLAAAFNMLIWCKEQKYI